jgi:hypothetical protein
MFNPYTIAATLAAGLTNSFQVTRLAGFFRYIHFFWALAAKMIDPQTLFS